MVVLEHAQIKQTFKQNQKNRKMLSEGVDIGALEESRAGLEALDGAQHPEHSDTQLDKEHA